MRKRRKNFFKYESNLEEYPEVVTTLNTVIPEWFKKTRPWKNDKIEVFPQDTSTFKQCSSFTDSFLTGYALTLPVDVLVTPDGPDLFTWRSNYVPLKQRMYQSNEHLPIPHGHYPIEFTWIAPAALHIPDGYCLLFTHPLNRYDLPFTTLSGVIDGKFTMGAKGLLPFFFKTDFSGVIPKGTPIAQLIPFKREAWILKEEKGLIKEGAINILKSASVLTGWYKKNIWKKKTFN